MNLDLTRKTAIVCGSTQGLGYASAVELALMGANVVLFARNEAKLKEIVQTLDTSRGQSHSYLVADFSNTAQVKETIGNYVTSGNIAHILVNNTGGPASGKLINETDRSFLDAFNAHLINNQSPGTGAGTRHESSRLGAHHQHHFNFGESAFGQPWRKQYHPCGSSPLV